MLLLQSGDTEVNPGSKKSSRLNFSHWKFNGIHDFAQVPLIKAFIKASNIDIICFSEIFSDSTIPFDEERLYLKGHSMIGIDHPSNTKRGGVCIYQKECLALSRRNDTCKLNEC